MDCGLYTLVKERTKFPQCLPLPCHMEHGIHLRTGVMPTDLMTNMPLMLVNRL